MRLLLDECLPKRLKRAFVGFEVSTVPEMGWAGTKDGALLKLALEDIESLIPASLQKLPTLEVGVQRVPDREA